MVLIDGEFDSVPPARVRANGFCISPLTAPDTSESARY